MNRVRLPMPLKPQLTATFIVVFSGAALACASARATVSFSFACATGYYVGPHGNCQQNGGYVDSRCPPGFEAQVFPNGDHYRCAPDSQAD